MLPLCYWTLAKAIRTTIRPEFNLGSPLIYLFYMYATIRQKYMVFFHFWSFFSARPFDQKLGSSLIYLFYVHATIWPQYMVLFHLFFLLSTTIRPKINVHTDLFLVCTRPFDQKLGTSLIYFFCLNTTIRPNYRFLFHLFLLQCTTIRPKIEIHIDLFLYLHTTIWPNYRILFHLFYSFFSAQPFD